MNTILAFTGYRFIVSFLLGESWLPYIKAIVPAYFAMLYEKATDMERFGLYFVILALFYVIEIFFSAVYI